MKGWRIAAAVMAAIWLGVAPIAAKDVALAGWGRVSVPEGTRVIPVERIPGLSATEAVSIAPVRPADAAPTDNPLYAWALEQEARMKEMAHIRITSVAPDTDTHATVVKRRTPRYTGYQVLSPHGRSISTAFWLTTTLPHVRADRFRGADAAAWADLMQRTILGAAWPTRGAAVTVTERETTAVFDGHGETVVTTGARLLVHTDGGAVWPLAVRVYGRLGEDDLPVLAVFCMDDDRQYFTDLTQIALTQR